MKKRARLFLFSLVLILLISMGFTSAAHFDSNFQKISNYAEEYEIGNINYAQFLVYLSAERQDMENYLGVKFFSEDKIQAALGEPTRTEREIYSKKDGKMLENGKDNKIWERTLFDGNKLRIDFRIEPFIYYDSEKKEETLIYGLGIYTNFKTKEELSRNNCKEYDSINCSGKLMFRGKDKDGCPLEPLCLEKNDFCTKDEECNQPRCGKSSCLDGICKTTDLVECKEEECIAGDKKELNCISGDILIVAVCDSGLWKDTGEKCVEKDNSSVKENEQCNEKTDCEGDSICSNGECIFLPKDIETPTPEEEDSQVQEEVQPIEQEENTEDVDLQASITGQVVDDENEKTDEEKKKEEELKNNEKENGEIKKEEIKDVCSMQYNQALLQRRELEKSLNNEFAKWFLEEYIPNSAEEWDTRTSTLDDIYWIAMDTAQILALNKKCANAEDSFNLIKMNYSATYGTINFWEEYRSVDASELGIRDTDSKGKVEVISPYLGIWVYPSREFLEYKMNWMMAEEKFNKWDNPNESIADDDFAGIRNNEEIMDGLENLINTYGKEGKLKVKILFVDYNLNKTLLGYYAEADMQDILKVRPMFPEKMPQEDVYAEADFNKLLSLMEKIQKETMELDIRAPDWDRSFHPIRALRKIELAISVWFKLRDFVKSTKVVPNAAKEDAISFAYKIVKSKFSKENIE